jgi:putative hydrolase of the HAD superfamily
VDSGHSGHGGHGGLGSTESTQSTKSAVHNPLCEHDPVAFDLIAFDADDTLWHNEPIFHATEKQFAEMLGAYHPAPWVSERLFATEMKNLRHFGYGIKGFILSMIETAVELTEGRVTGDEVRRILTWGHEMLMHPVELLDGVRETVESLSSNYRLMLLTKGDLFDQESKLARSGIGEHFQAVEIVSEKNAGTYRAIMKRHGVAPDRFLMVGNSLRSDVLPVLDAGAMAVHVPYELTWMHERIDEDALRDKQFGRIERIVELVEWVGKRRGAAC